MRLCTTLFCSRSLVVYVAHGCCHALALRQDCHRCPRKRRPHAGARFQCPRVQDPAFGLSGLLAGLAGALYATHANFAHPSNAGVLFSTQVVIWVADRRAPLAHWRFRRGHHRCVACRTICRASKRSRSYWPLLQGLIFIAAIILFREGLAGLVEIAVSETETCLRCLEPKTSPNASAALSLARILPFSCDKGEVRCVIGPNGAGKTTFISMISGHVNPTAGRFGSRIATSPTCRFPAARKSALDENFRRPACLKA